MIDIYIKGMVINKGLSRAKLGSSLAHRPVSVG
jgi:hypothetical protein